MHFELNDVASSSSSSSSSSQSESDQGDDRSDNGADQQLADELRAALHLVIGNTCRAEEDAEQSQAESSGPAFTMTDKAILALTDLTYHYSTSLFANDLVAFSKHAKRQTVKTDDVLLVARKDKKRMLADLKRLISENPDYFFEGSRRSKVQDRRSSSASITATARKRASTKKTSHNVNSDRRSITKSKGSTKPRKPRSSLSSSSASSSSSSDGGSDDAVTTRRKKLALKRTNLSEGAFRGRNRNENDGCDLSTITNKDSFDNDSNSDVGLELGTAKKEGGKKNSLGNETRPSKNERGNNGQKNKNNSPRSLLQGNVDSDDHMVIDLASD